MIGERIYRARLGAGLSQDELARRVGISKMAISKYEHGKMTPSSEVLIALSHALGVRTEFFLRSSDFELGEVSFRRRSSLGSKHQAKIKADVLEQVERFLELMDLFPQRPCVEFVRPATLPTRVGSLEEIEDIADAVRNEWQLGLDAIQNLSDTLERQGVLVIQTSVEVDSKFDGLSAEVAGQPVIVVGASWPGDRQRFTMAHELGHLLLDEALLEGIDHEAAANRFAGAFLAPAESVRCALGDHRTQIELQELSDLKRRFGLSMAGWLFRALDLGIINSRYFKRVMVDFRSRRWHKKEPGEVLRSEEPRLFHQLVHHALAEEMIGVSKAAELLGTSVAEFRMRRRMEVTSAAAHQ